MNASEDNLSVLDGMSETKDDVPGKILIAILVWLLAWAIVFWPSLRSAFDVWMVSSTYNHGIFVLPIAAYFFWHDRFEVLARKPSPQSWLLFVSLGLVAIWAIGMAGNINVFQHAAIFLLLPAVFMMSCGFMVSKAIAFPLLFILFAIPVGEEIVPWLQDVTADIAVFLLKLSNVPVFRDGLYISIPEGKFKVAETCSGIRFFISTQMLGMVFGYLHYQKNRKRVLFMLVCIVFPILANGARAYGTIMVGHYIDMKHAVGFDHLVFGSLFFAFVIISLFLISSLWRDPPANWRAKNYEVIDSAWVAINGKKILLIAFLPLFIALFIRVFVFGAGIEDKGGVNENNLPGVTRSMDESWWPQFPMAAKQVKGYMPVSSMEYYLAWYPNNEEGRELISWQNRFYRKENWTLNQQEAVPLCKNGDCEIKASLLDLVSPRGDRRLIVYWYQLPDRTTSKKLYVKLWQTKDVITGGTGAGAFVAVSREYKNDYEQARTAMIGQLDKLFPALSSSVNFER